MAEDNIDEFEYQEEQAIEFDSSIIKGLREIGGIGDITAKKLILSNYITKEQIAAAKPETLSEMSGIPVKKCIDIISKARSKVKTRIFTAAEVLDKRKDIKKFTTGVKDIDRILGGGLECPTILEVAGEFRTGKTQLAHQLCVTVQLPEKDGGLNGKALLIDCERNFRPERLQDIAKRFKLDPQKVLNNTYIIKSLNSDDLLGIMDNNIPDLLKDDKDIKLIIIDSIITHLRGEYVGRGTLAERQQKLNKMLNKLAVLSEEQNITIYYTNQVSTDVGSMTFFPIIKPTGGNIMGHAANFRLQAKKASGNQRVVKIIDGPIAEAEAVFAITENGLEDVKSKGAE